MVFIVQIYRERRLLDGIWGSCSSLLLVLKHLKAIPLLTIPLWEPAQCWNAGNLQWNPIRLMVPPFFGACFISLLFATDGKAISQCNLLVYGWSFASLISALEVNYKKRLQPYSVFAFESFNISPSRVVNHVPVSYTNCASETWRDRNM